MAFNCVELSAVPTGMSAGFVQVMTGVGRFTVSVAGSVELEPTAFVKMARYWLPFMAKVTAVSVRLVDVAPGMSVKVTPPLVLTCQRTGGIGSS